jgi:hypothetical protein
MSLRVIDDAPPIRDLVVIGVGETDTPFGDQTLDQLLRLRPSSTSDGPFTVRRLAALTTGAFALPACFRRRWRPSGHLLDASGLERWILGVMAMSEIEPAGLGDLRTAEPADPADRQKPTVAQGIGRAPDTWRPGSRFFTSREAFEKSALPFVRRRPPVHGDQPTPRPRTLHRAEGVALGPGQPSMAESAVSERLSPLTATQRAYGR